MDPLFCVCLPGTAAAGGGGWGPRGRPAHSLGDGVKRNRVGPAGELRIKQSTGFTGPPGSRGAGQALPAVPVSAAGGGRGDGLEALGVAACGGGVPGSPQAPSPGVKGGTSAPHPHPVMMAGDWRRRLRACTGTGRGGRHRARRAAGAGPGWPPRASAPSLCPSTFSCGAAPPGPFPAGRGFPTVTHHVPGVCPSGLLPVPRCFHLPGAFLVFTPLT